MLSLRDCLDFAEIDNAAIEAIADCKNIPLIVAAELGHNMMACSGGASDILKMVQAGIEQAREEGRDRQAAHLTQLYQNLQSIYSL